MDGTELIECNKPVIRSRRWNGPLLFGFPMLAELKSPPKKRKSAEQVCTLGELPIDSVR